MEQLRSGQALGAAGLGQTPLQDPVRPHRPCTEAIAALPWCFPAPAPGPPSPLPGGGRESHAGRASPRSCPPPGTFLSLPGLQVLLTASGEGPSPPPCAWCPPFLVIRVWVWGAHSRQDVLLTHLLEGPHPPDGQQEEVSVADLEPTGLSGCKPCFPDLRAG